MDQDIRVFYASGMNTTSGFRISIMPASEMPDSLKARAERSVADWNYGAVRKLEMAGCPDEAEDFTIGRAIEKAMAAKAIALNVGRCDFSVVEPYMPVKAPGPRM